MTTTDPLSSFGTNIPTHQSQPVPGRTDQVANNAGGFVFQIDPLSQFRRFLTIGSTGGTYYVGESELTKENGNLILELAKDPTLHTEAVDLLVEISLGGRAMKQNPTLFALAILCQHGETESKQHARKQITKVARTGTMLFIFMRYLLQFGGINRGLRREIGKWYTERPSDRLALQLVKYRQREGFTHRDVLRLIHPSYKLKDSSPALVEAVDWSRDDVLEQMNSILDPQIREEMAELRKWRAAIDWTVKGTDPNGANPEGVRVSDVIRTFNEVNDPAMNPEAIARRLKDHNLPWEALPDSAMNDVAVWDVLLDNGMPLGALLRQLPRLTRLGMLPQIGGRTNEVINALLDEEQLRRARIHPFQVLLALKTYQQGHGEQGKSVWTPSGKIVSALDQMFYASFGNVEPTGLRRMDALDVSGSMGSLAGGRLPMTCREVCAAMAMVSVRTERNQMTVGFTGGKDDAYFGFNRRHQPLRGFSPDGLTDLALNDRQSLKEVVDTISGLPFGRTDCALPMVVAKKRELEIDTFVIYTDNETWYGGIHPFQALREYRKASGIPARLVVVSITPTKFSIADPTDPGMIDISGFDSAVPNLIADFARGWV